MSGDRELTVSDLENWLWEAACKIRGPIDAPKYKDYILPLIFLKRLSDVFEDEIASLSEEFGSSNAAGKFVEEDHSLIRFYLPPDARWQAIAAKTTKLGEHLTGAARAVARENPRLGGVIDVVDFNATTAGQRIIGEEHLKSLIQILGRYRLGINDVEPDILGRAYEYLLRKFAEGSGQSAGEFYTPRQVAILMARILEPEPGAEVYDPCCGSGGLLIKCHLRLLGTHGEVSNGRRRLPSSVEPLRLFRQEINHSTFAMAKMNAFIHDMETQIRLGDTMHKPAFLKDDGSLRRFDVVTANPMWNQDFPLATYEKDAFDRFELGIPPASSADWGWIQHMHSSLKDGGRMAVVLDTGSVARGSGNQGSNRERDIRRKLVDKDLVEAVLLLPENLFYNTTAPGIILVINKTKRHRGELLLINASQQFVKGRPKNELSNEHVERIGSLYHDWRAEENLSAAVPLPELVKNDYNLSPSRYVSLGGKEDVLPLDEAVVLLKEAEEERTEADSSLRDVLLKLGFPKS